MIDSVHRKDLKSLVLRVAQGNFSIFVNFMAIKYFDLTTVAMVVNCAPLLTVVLAAPILGERIFAIQVVYLLLAFGAVSIMILGDPDRGSEKKDKITPSTIAITALVLNPIAIALGNLAMRSMRKLNENVVSCWMSCSMIIIFVPIVFIQG
jgi:drug/metabolite transporter (DMT)-like permease